MGRIDKIKKLSDEEIKMRVLIVLVPYIIFLIVAFTFGLPYLGGLYGIDRSIFLSRFKLLMYASVIPIFYYIYPYGQVYSERKKEKKK